MNTKRPHHRFKPVLIPAITMATGPIRHGLAVIAYDERANCWLLPVGPNQKDRRVYDESLAREFAVRLNDILSHYPQLAARLDKVAA